MIPAFPRKSQEVAMKKSLLTSGIVDKFLRMCRFILPAILVLGATAASAQQNNFVGQWRGVYEGITFTIVFQANGQYTQTLQNGATMTQQSGPYTLAAPNTIIFSVTDWQPRTQQIYHPTGTVGGYYTNEVVAKPPGATDSYVFNGPNSVTLTDQVMHGSITLTRVP
jgi:hypothetical protein